MSPASGGSSRRRRTGSSQTPGRPRHRPALALLGRRSCRRGRGPRCSGPSSSSPTRTCPPLLVTMILPSGVQASAVGATAVATTVSLKPVGEIDGDPVGGRARQVGDLNHPESRVGTATTTTDAASRTPRAAGAPTRVNTIPDPLPRRTSVARVTPASVAAGRPLATARPHQHPDGRSAIHLYRARPALEEALPHRQPRLSARPNSRGTVAPRNVGRTDRRARTVAVARPPR